MEPKEDRASLSEVEEQTVGASHQQDEGQNRSLWYLVTHQPFVLGAALLASCGGVSFGYGKHLLVLPRCLVVTNWAHF